jgi:death-on-curing protein
MRYLTVEEVLEINAEVMRGRHALRDLGLLESAVARPQASAFGADAYPDLASKAAALLHSLVLNHAFVDGNKRTAVLATLVFLDLNGYMVRWDQHEALDFVLSLATHQVELEDAVTFLRKRMHSKGIVTPHSSTK